MKKNGYGRIVNVTTHVSLFSSTRVQVSSRHDRLNGDPVAERFKLADGLVLGAHRVAPGVVVTPEIGIAGVVGEHVPDRGEDGPFDRDDSQDRSAPSRDPTVTGPPDRCSSTLKRTLLRHRARRRRPRPAQSASPAQASATRAKALALEHGYRRLESLQRAREQLRAEQRDCALQQLLIRQIKAQHDAAVLASIAATAPVATLAAALTARFDTDGWVDYLAAYLRPPESPDARVQPAPGSAASSAELRPEGGTPDETPKMDERFDNRVDDGTDSGGFDAPDGDSGGEDALPDGVLVPSTPARYQRWRDLWHQLSALPAEQVPAFAQAHNVSVCTLQRIRQAGEAGSLDEESPPTQRSRLMLVNGHRDA
jgi:hypothetical protein